MSEQGHPITNEIIRQTLLDRSLMRHDVPHGGDFEEVSTKLDQIQEILHDNLRTLVSWAYYPPHESSISMFWESPDVFIFHDSSGIIKIIIKQILNIRPLIQGMHTKMTEALMNSYPELPVEEGDYWIVRKHSAWRDGEWSRINLLTQLIERGLTPTQAVDYLMVEILDYRVARWAWSRNTSTQSIWSNIQDAEETLESSTSDLPESPHKPNTRTYFGTYEDGEYIVTVDGGYLYPRRDILLYTRTGEFAWGYGGSGPHQLATAILVDALGCTMVPSDVITRFLHYLDEHLWDQDEWHLKQNEVVSWAKANTALLE